jgi:dihydroorotase-like cyclic amidohydrolase
MSEVDLVIRGGHVVTPDAVFNASVAVKDGVVAAVGADELMPPARDVLDASGLHVLPGAIDVHVHFRDPGYPHKEDFSGGTAAAALGGVTTVFDMPNTLPPTGTAEALAAKQTMAAEKAHVDFGLYGLLGEDTIAQVPALVAGGVIGFSSTWATPSAASLRRPPAPCWKRSRRWRRPASASRCTRRRTPSWSGGRRACAKPDAPRRWPTSPRARRWSPSRR